MYIQLTVTPKASFTEAMSVSVNPTPSHSANNVSWAGLVEWAREGASVRELEDRVRGSVRAVVAQPAEWYAIGIELTIRLHGEVDQTVLQRLGEAYLYATTDDNRQASLDTEFLYTGMLGPMVGKLASLRPALNQLLGPRPIADRMFLFEALLTNDVAAAEQILGDIAKRDSWPAHPIEFLQLALEMACIQTLPLRLGALFIHVTRREDHAPSNDHCRTLMQLECVLALEFGQASLDQAVACM